MLGCCLVRHDHVCGTRKRQMAQAQVNAASAKTLAGASKEVYVMDGHDHRAGAAQDRAIDPRRVEHMGAPGTMRLDYLDALVGYSVEGGEQAARIVSDAAHLNVGPAVEGDPHHVRRSHHQARTTTPIHVSPTTCTACQHSPLAVAMCGPAAKGSRCFQWFARGTGPRQSHLARRDRRIRTALALPCDALARLSREPVGVRV